MTNQTNLKATATSVVLFLCLFMVSCGGGGDSQPSPWIGSYEGTYTGSEDGSYIFQVLNDGTMSATIQSPSVGTFHGSGYVAQSGQMSATMHGSGVGGPFTITYTGTFVNVGGLITGSGNWVSTSGFTGTWSCQRTGP